jgi:D-alanine--poly(phosphoribitol) ligase subunit 2
MENFDGTRRRSRNRTGELMTISDKVIEVLKSVSETDEVQKNLDLALYDLQILDTLKTVRLIVAISQEFGIDIPPSEFERDRWATPRKIVADIENKIGI